MSRIYQAVNGREALQALAEGKIPSLTRHVETSDTAAGKRLWVDAATDGKNYGWFEEDMLLFWGLNDEAPILAAFRHAGYHYRYVG